MKKGLYAYVAGSTLWFASAQGAVAQDPPPPPPPPPPVTLWRFLGIPQGVQAVRDVTTNRSGYFPEYERKPPLMRIGDPANLQSDNPAIKKAAEIKIEADLAKQKIKALKYLGEVGCGCYPGVAEVLMAALDDCTEEVRYEAAKAIFNASGKQRNLREKLQHVHVAGPHEVVHEAYVKAKKGIHGAIHLVTGKNDELAKKFKDKIHSHRGKHHGGGEQACPCGDDSCCSEAVTAKLAEIVYERNGDGCYKEPSERVRQMAAEALRACCPNSSPFPYPGVPIEQVPVGPTVPPPVEPVPDVEPIPGVEGVPDAPVAPVPDSPEVRSIFTPPVPISSTESRDAGQGNAHAQAALSHDPSAMNRGASIAASYSKPAEASNDGLFRQSGILARLPQVAAEHQSQQAATSAGAFLGSATNEVLPEAQSAAEAPANPVRARIAKVDGRDGTVELDFLGDGHLPAGYRMKVYRQYLLKRTLIGELEIASVDGQQAVARPVGPLKVSQLSRGDDGIFLPSKDQAMPTPVADTVLASRELPTMVQSSVEMEPDAAVATEQPVVEADSVFSEDTAEDVEVIETAGPAMNRRQAKPVVQAAQADEVEEDGTVFISDPE